jgi:hypothetical protein
MAMLDGVIVDQSIDFARGDPRLNERAQIVHQLRVETTCSAHPVALNFCQLQLSQILQHRCLKFPVDPLSNMLPCEQNLNQRWAE